MSDPLNHLGSIWYHSKPLQVPYSPNQFLGWDFFCSIIQQIVSNLIFQNFEKLILIFQDPNPVSKLPISISPSNNPKNPTRTKPTKDPLMRLLNKGEHDPFVNFTTCHKLCKKPVEKLIFKKLFQYIILIKFEVFTTQKIKNLSKKV